MTAGSNGNAPDDGAAARFVAALEDGPRKRDAETLLPWFERVTGLAPCLWGGSSVGYGRYRYRYDSGREGEHFQCGFSPRKKATTIHVMPGYRFDTMADRFARLGPHRLGKSCIYVTRLDGIDLDVLAGIVGEGLAWLRAHHETSDR